LPSSAENNSLYFGISRTAIKPFEFAFPSSLQKGIRSSIGILCFMQNSSEGFSPSMHLLRTTPKGF